MKYTYFVACGTMVSSERDGYGITYDRLEDAEKELAELKKDILSGDKDNEYLYGLDLNDMTEDEIIEERQRFADDHYVYFVKRDIHGNKRGCFMV